MELDYEKICGLEIPPHDEKETRTMNFTQYWKQNKELYKQLGVTEAAAYRIWCDAVDEFAKLAAKKL